MQAKAYQSFSYNYEVRQGHYSGFHLCPATDARVDLRVEVSHSLSLIPSTMVRG